MKNYKDYSLRKSNEPRRYYFGIIQYFSDKFPGVVFEYKLIDRDYNVLKNLKRTFLPCFTEDLSEAFIKDT